MLADLILDEYQQNDRMNAFHSILAIREYESIEHKHV